MRLRLQAAVWIDLQWTDARLNTSSTSATGTCTNWCDNSGLARFGCCDNVWVSCLPMAGIHQLRDAARLSCLALMRCIYVWSGVQLHGCHADACKCGAGCKVMHGGLPELHRPDDSVLHCKSGLGFSPRPSFQHRAEADAVPRRSLT